MARRSQGKGTATVPWESVWALESPRPSYLAKDAGHSWKDPQRSSGARMIGADPSLWFPHCQASITSLLRHMAAQEAGVQFG